MAKWTSQGSFSILLAAAVCLVLIFAGRSYKLETRIHLLSYGYVFCHLVPADQVDTAELPHVLVSRVVYQDRTCIGYMNRDGYFFPKSKTDLMDLDQDIVRQATVDQTLFLLRWGMILIVVAIAAIHFKELVTRRPGGSQS